MSEQINTANLLAGRTIVASSETRESTWGTHDLKLMLDNGVQIALSLEGEARVETGPPYRPETKLRVHAHFATDPELESLYQSLSYPELAATMPRPIVNRDPGDECDRRECQ